MTTGTSTDGKTMFLTLDELNAKSACSSGIEFALQSNILDAWFYYTGDHKHYFEWLENEVSLKPLRYSNEFNWLGQLVKQTIVDESSCDYGKKTYYKYNDLGQLIEARDWDSTTLYFYNLGNLITVRQIGGEKDNCTYNEYKCINGSDKLVSSTYSVGEEERIKVEYTYDDLGQLIKIEDREVGECDGSSVTEYEYIDSLIVSERTERYINKREYDSERRLIKSVINYEDGSKTELIISYI